MDNISREEIIKKAREIAAQLEVDVLRLSDFIKKSGISKTLIYNLFPEGGWTEVLEKAELKTGGSGYKLNNDVLLNEFHRVVMELGRIPTWQLFRSRSKLCVDTIRKRFGGRKGTLKRYQIWLENNDPNSPILQQINSKLKNEILVPIENIHQKSEIPQHWIRTSGPVFGTPINFRGLTHAPINELGVVYLFGMVSNELGYKVESIQPNFPDCEAKRCVDKNRDFWQRVRIEFEYKSSNFNEHCHDSSKCDLIICWEHDWKDCPIEVLELRTLINDLNAKNSPDEVF